MGRYFPQGTPEYREDGKYKQNGHKRASYKNFKICCTSRRGFLRAVVESMVDFSHLFPYFARRRWYRGHWRWNLRVCSELYNSGFRASRTLFDGITYVSIIVICPSSYEVLLSSYIWLVGTPTKPEVERLHRNRVELCPFPMSKRHIHSSTYIKHSSHKSW